MTLTRASLDCRKCPRLVRWREACAKKPPRRYLGEEYWAKSTCRVRRSQSAGADRRSGAGAHGGNRTGRMFTGDRSGDWLYGALYQAGFANQPNSDYRDDGLKLTDCYVTAAVHCAPPANKPNLIEFKRCRSYLIEELRLLAPSRSLSCLARSPSTAFLAAYRETGGSLPKPRPKFGHGASFELANGLRLICSYHPSQQNTFTGKLTRAMFKSVFDRPRPHCWRNCQSWKPVFSMPSLPVFFGAPVRY